jgi:soluble P-type ATPase
MLQFDIPGYGALRLEHLVLDYNGTLACDGILIEGARARLGGLSNNLKIHVLTADTFGKVKSALAGVPCELSILPPEKQDDGKLDYVRRLGCDKTVCIGNGRNDRLMIKAAALGIAVIQREGAAGDTLVAADVVATDVLDALDLLTHPLRLVATLRA